MSVFILFVSGGVLYFVYITSDRLVVRSVLQSNGNRNVIGSIRHVSCFNVFPVYKFGPFFEPILGWWRHKVESKFQNFQKAFTQRNNSRQSTFYFWFSSFYQHCYMKNQFGSFWHIFGLMTSPRGVKALKHWDSGFKKGIIHLKFPFAIDFHLFLSPSIHDIQLCALLTQFGDNGITKERNIPEFWKINWKIISDLLKCKWPEV